MKHLIVVNGNAGGYNPEFEAKINEAFKGLDYEVYKTTGPKSVIPFLKDYLKKNTDTVRVYACGGDGTVNEVVNGVVGFKNAEVAIYASGTGNDFVKIYGGAEKFRDFKTLIDAKAAPVDISELKGDGVKEVMYSINVINFGFDAIVGAMGNYYKENGLPEEAKKKGLDPYDYALKHDAMKHGRFNDIEVFADGEKLNEKQMLLATLAHGQYVGGKFRCAPKSVNNDGLIDVCVLKTMTFLGLGLIIGPYTDGKHLNKKKRKVVYRRAKEIKMVSPKDFDVCVDGEMIKGNNFTVKVLPGAINLVIPQ